MTTPGQRPALFLECICRARDELQYPVEGLPDSVPLEERDRRADAVVLRAKALFDERVKMER